MTSDLNPPKAFLSYSHDSEAHKAWVRELAERLMRDGVHVVLDQWDLSIGDELTHFMERSLEQSDYVLLVCSETYAQRANERAGGVGYETSMLSNLLLKQAPVMGDGRSRVIPVLRQSRRPRVLPRFVGSRLYVDLSADSDGTGYEVLLRTLHNTPQYVRPALGRNPFALAGTPSSGNEDSPIAGSEQSHSLSRQLRVARTAASEALVARGAQFPYLGGVSADQRHDELVRVIQTHSDYLQMLLRAAQLGQLSSRLFAEEVENLIAPSGWPSNGPTRLVELPYVLGWTAHHLVGAALLEKGHAGLAVSCAREAIQNTSNIRQMVVEDARLTGWPVNGGLSNEAWASLRRLPTDFPWLNDAFGDSEEYWTAIVAHMLALNFAEFVVRVEKGPKFDVVIQGREHSPRVPLYFWGESPETRRRSYRMLIRDPDGLRIALGTLAEAPDIQGRWASWLRFQRSWISIEMGGGSAPGEAPHADLIDVVLGVDS